MQVLPLTRRTYDVSSRRSNVNKSQNFLWLTNFYMKYRSSIEYRWKATGRSNTDKASLFFVLTNSLIPPHSVLWNGDFLLKAKEGSNRKEDLKNYHRRQFEKCLNFYSKCVLLQPFRLLFVIFLSMVGFAMCCPHPWYHRSSYPAPVLCSTTLDYSVSSSHDAATSATAVLIGILKMHNVIETLHAC